MRERQSQRHQAVQRPNWLWVVTMDAVVQEEAERLQAIRALTSQRTRIASLAAENARQAREAGEEVSLKELVVEVRLSDSLDAGADLLESVLRHKPAVADVAAMRSLSGG